MADEEQVTAPTTEQVDLERRYVEEGLMDPKDVSDQAAVPEARSFEVEGNDTSAYVGVSPEYMGYGDETQRPYAAEGGVQQVAEEKFAEAISAEAPEAVEADEQTQVNAGVIAPGQSPVETPAAQPAAASTPAGQSAQPAAVSTPAQQ